MRPPKRNPEPGGPASSSSTVIPGDWTTSGDPGLITPRGSVAGAWAKQPSLVVKPWVIYEAERRLDPAPEGLEGSEDYQEEARGLYSLVTEEDLGPTGTPENEEELILFSFSKTSQRSFWSGIL